MRHLSLIWKTTPIEKASDSFQRRAGTSTQINRFLLRSNIAIRTAKRNAEKITPGMMVRSNA